MTDALADENNRLKKELQEMQAKRDAEIRHLEKDLQSERDSGKAYSEQLDQKAAELSSMRNKMSKLTKQLDEEVTRRDMAQSEAQTLACKVQDLNEGAAMTSSGSHSKGKGISFEKERGTTQDDHASHASTKLMRVVEHWMQHKDMQQALLRSAGINDMAFSTLSQVLFDCSSLQTLDLASNQLTMDSCSEICNLITSSPSLSFVSLADNRLSVRSIGYFMTAVMERQNTKKLAPLDLLDLHGNEGLVAAAAAPPPEALYKQVVAALGPTRLPPRGAELISQVMRALWRFLNETGHPQVRNADMGEAAFNIMDKSTIRKMENALMKILLLAEEVGDAMVDSARAVTGDLIFLTTHEYPVDSPSKGKDGVHLPPIDQPHSSMQLSTQSEDKRGAARDKNRQARSEMRETRDPFADLKQAFEPPKEKLKTFNLKQIVTRNGTVLMNMLERLLETTEIDAKDVETEQTLLEFACQTGNVGLAKLCYRRGANLSARTQKGDTAFTIVTKNKRYDIMEFLHMYGVKVNSCDADGKTALHWAASNDDVDAVCRLLEWGADVNLRDNKKQTPLHASAKGGHFAVTMLLLEVGAEMNAKDEREYTPAAWAEACDHFKLMDRLVQLGGKGHGLSQKSNTLATSKSAKQLGELNVSPQMLKSSSLGRIGKVKVKDLPDPLRPSLTK